MESRNPNDKAQAISLDVLIHAFCPFLLLVGGCLVSTFTCFPQFIDRFEEEIPRLRAEMEQLEAQIWEPREIVFADVLLRRSK